MILFGLEKMAQEKHFIVDHLKCRELFAGLNAGGAMNNLAIEAAMKNYVSQRMTKGKAQARENFIAFAYLKIGRDEVPAFMKRVVGISRYYVNLLKVMEKPVRVPEMLWLSAMALVAIFSCLLIIVESERLLGILLFPGAMIHMFVLGNLIVKRWRNTGVMIEIYNEIAEIAEEEATERL